LMLFRLGRGTEFKAESKGSPRLRGLGGVLTHS
jgi:hypothetical protein